MTANSPKGGLAPKDTHGIEAILNSNSVTPVTRQALRSRLAWSPPQSPQCFEAGDYAVLEAICDRLIPQPQAAPRVQLAAWVDARLAAGLGDGWRYDCLPDDRTAITQGVKGIDETARHSFHAPFRALSPAHQDMVLAAVQNGSAQGDIWRALPPKRLFEELLVLVTELYYAHPIAQDRIRYLGMADAQGFWVLGLNQRDPVETDGPDGPV